MTRFWRAKVRLLIILVGMIIFSVFPKQALSKFRGKKLQHIFMGKRPHVPTAGLWRNGTRWKYMNKGSIIQRYIFHLKMERLTEKSAVSLLILNIYSIGILWTPQLINYLTVNNVNSIVRQEGHYICMKFCIYLYSGWHGH